jgi:hypothetical protein
MAGGAYRSRSVESTNRARETTTEARQPRRGVLADSNRTTTTAPRTESSSTYRGNAGVQRAPSNAGVQRAPSNANRGTVRTAPRAPGSAAAPERAYRSGGGMSQARERVQSEPSRPTPRAAQPSTGMPRQAPRSSESQSSPPRAAPQTSREPSGGGMSQAQRGGDGGSYRGGGNSNGGGSYRSDSGGGSSRGGDGGGRQHPAARGSEGRSAGR